MTVTLTFPSAIPAGAHLYKSDCGTPGAHEADGLVQSINGNTMTISLTDGARGDCDAVPGQITDPQGLVVDGQADQNPLDVAQFPIGFAALLLVALPVLLLARRRSLRD